MIIYHSPVQVRLLALDVDRVDRIEPEPGGEGEPALVRPLGQRRQHYGRPLPARKAKEHVRPVPVGHLLQHVEQLGRVPGPFAVDGLHRAEQQLQLLDRDTVAGQHAQHFDEEIFGRGLKGGKVAVQISNTPKLQKLTSHDGLRPLEPLQHVLDQPDLGAGLQVADALLQDRDEHAPHLGLQVRRTVVQQLEHVFHVLGVLHDKVQLHVELTPDQLQGLEHCDGKRKRERKKSVGLEIGTRICHSWKAAGRLLSRSEFEMMLLESCLSQTAALQCSSFLVHHHC